MEWAEETIVRLRALWDEGLSTAEIGRRLGVSKNAVVGKAHRLDLPARPSPIRRDGGGGTPRRSMPRRVAGPTLPPLSSTAQIAATSSAGALPHYPALVAKPVPVAPPVRVAPPAPRYGRVVTCCWPLGEPGTRSFRFCDDASEPGKPYCSEHVKLAYVKIRDRREDAA
jgi:GcrA cell cycle regulator